MNSLLSLKMAVVLLGLQTAVGFFLKPSNRFILSNKMSSQENIVENQDFYENILLSGFISKTNNFSENDIFVKVFNAGFTADKGSGSGKMFTPGSKLSSRKLTALVDDVPFAKKRIVSPKAVYSGLVDSLNYIDENFLESTLSSHDCWVAYNVSSSDILTLSSMARNSGIKRVIFVVNLSQEEGSKHDIIFQDATELLKSSNIKYTILKHGKVTNFAEAKFPYRVVRGTLPLPTPEDKILSSGDLMRVISEIIDIPKTYGNVYGIGPGTNIDTEILVYMKSQGWPERVQVGLLVGDMMEKIEKMYEEEANKKIGTYEGVKRPKRDESSYEEPNYLLNI